MAAKRPPGKRAGKGRGKGQLSAVSSRGSCGACGKSLEGRRGNAKYCDEKCRRDFRVGKRPADAADRESRDEFIDVGSVLESTKEKLEEADRVSSPAGRAALKLAARIDVAYRLDSAAGLAALTKQYHDTLDKALDGAVVEGDLVDELTERRRKRLAKLQ